MKSKLTKLFWGLWCIGVVTGLVLSFQQNRLVAELESTHRDVKAQTGLLKVDDPSKVYITSVIEPVVPIVLQAENVRVWQFQMHLPIGYGVSVAKLSSLIGADGIKSQGGTSTSTSSPKKEAIRGLWTFCLYQEDDEWVLSSSGPSNSGRTRLHDIESADDLIVRTISPESGKTVEIEPDAFFNLFRLRSATKAPNRRTRNSESDLYPGVAYWVGPKVSRSAFDAVRKGSENPDELAKVHLNAGAFEYRGF